MMTLTTRDRERALLAGNWGDSAAIRSAAEPWFESAGIPHSNVVAARVHPLLHFAAEISHGDGQVDQLPSFDHAEALTLTTAASIADRQLGDSGTDVEFRRIISERIAPNAIVDVDDTQYETIVQATQLLFDVVPDLARDVMEYLHLFVLTDRSDMIGETWMEYPGLVIFGPAAFKTPKVLAESLLHEALHSKTVWLERAMPRLQAEQADDDENTDEKPIAIPWRREKDESVTHWSSVRAFDAYYVYAHLTVLASAIWEAEHLESDLDQFRRICFRAAYLSNQLRHHPKCAGIGSDRHDVIRWLETVRVPPFDLTPAGRRHLSVAA